jgi:hypothetical protein
MYFLKYVNGTQWHIVDSGQQTVFIGTKQQAEDWLDFQENARREAARSPKSFGGIARGIMRLPGRVLRGISSLVRGSHTGWRHRPSSLAPRETSDATEVVAVKSPGPAARIDKASGWPESHLSPGL